MTTSRPRDRTLEPRREALLYIDRDQAVIVEQGPGGRNCTLLIRSPEETFAGLDARAVDAIADRDRVVVSGPAPARYDFERIYVALTQRPDRLVDAAANVPTSRAPR